MSDKNSAVGIYKTHTEAEAAVKELQKSGFDMQKLSVVGKDYHTDEHVIGYYTPHLVATDLAKGAEEGCAIPHA